MPERTRQVPARMQAESSRDGAERLQGGLAAGAAIGTGAWRWPGRDPASAAPIRAPNTHGHIRIPGSLPYPQLAEGTDTVPQIEHIVVLMMENHSYDNKLGMLDRPGADGFKLRHGVPVAVNPYPNGDLQHAFHMPTTCQLSGQPSQEWAASHIQFDNGRNDGFVKSPAARSRWATGTALTSPSYSLASVFPIADRYFCSAAGADLSQPAVPHLRHVDRPGGRHPPERRRLSGERHHF